MCVCVCVIFSFILLLLIDIGGRGYFSLGAKLWGGGGVNYFLQYKCASYVGHLLYVTT